MRILVEFLRILLSPRGSLISENVALRQQLTAPKRDTPRSTTSAQRSTLLGLSEPHIGLMAHLARSGPAEYRCALASPWVAVVLVDEVAQDWSVHRPPPGHHLDSPGVRRKPLWGRLVFRRCFASSTLTSPYGPSRIARWRGRLPAVVRGGQTFLRNHAVQIVACD